MDVPVTEDQIRTLAFYLWEQDGGPDGRSDEYWEIARQQLGAGTEVDGPRPSDSVSGNNSAVSGIAVRRSCESPSRAVITASIG